MQVFYQTKALSVSNYDIYVENIASFFLVARNCLQFHGLNLKLYKIKVQLLGPFIVMTLHKNQNGVFLLFSQWLSHRHLGNRLLNSEYRLHCLFHQHCKRLQQKKKGKKPIMSGASSGHITKLKQSIILRCLWVECSTNQLSLLPNEKNIVCTFN